MIKKTSSWVLVTIIGVLFLFASIVITVRISLPKIGLYKAEIAEYLSTKLQVDISIGSIKAVWVKAKPQFYISDVSINDTNFNRRSIQIDQIEAELDVVQSVISFAPIFKHLSVNGLVAEVEQVNSQWLTVFSPGAVDAKKLAASDEKLALNRFLHVLAAQSKVSFSNAHLKLKPQNRPFRAVGPIDFLMENTRDMHQLSGQAKLTNYGKKSSVDFALQTEKFAPLILDTSYQLYAKFENLSQRLLAFNLINTGVKIADLSLSSEVWATFKKGVISNVSGSLDVDKLNFINPNYPKITASKLNFSMKKIADKQYINLSDIDLFNGETHLKIPQASAIYQLGREGYIEKVALSSLNLSKITKELLKQPLLDKEIKAVAERLNAKGLVENISVYWEGSDLSVFQLKADLQNVSVDSYSGAPELSGVTGLLEMNASGGSIDLNTTDFGLFFPQLFENKWQYETAKGRVSWEIKHKEGRPDRVIVNSQLLSIKDAKMHANGRFSVIIPFDKERQTELILMIGMQNTEADALLNYVPPSVVGRPLSQWINKAVLDAQVKEAAVVLRSGFRKNLTQKINPSVQVYLKSTQAKINFDQNWPNYLAQDLTFILDNENISVKSKHGSVASNETSDLQVTKVANRSIIEVDVKITGELDKLYTNLRKKPAFDYFPDELKTWALGGKHVSTLALELPLVIKKTDVETPNSEKNKDKLATNKVTDAELKIDVASKLQNAQLVDAGLKLKFNKITGQVFYSSQKGLKSSVLKLEAFGFPAELSIVSSTVDKALKTSIALDGRIKAQQLSDWLETNQLEKMKGDSRYSARLDLCSALPSCNQLVVNSDLVGMSIDLPAPWGKSPKQPRKFQLVSNRTGINGTIWRYNYADIVRGVSKFKAADDGLSNAFTSIVLGGERPKLVESPGIYIKGKLATVNLNKLIDLYNSASSSTLAKDTEKVIKQSSKDSNSKGTKAITEKSDSNLNALKEINLELVNVSLLDNKIPRGWINLKHSETHWNSHFDLGIARGELAVTEGVETKVNLHLSKLVLGGDPKQSASTLAKKSKKSRYYDTNKWPKVAVTIDQLIMNDLEIGNWSAKLTPVKHGYMARDIKGGIAETNFEANLVWIGGVDNVRTSFDLTAKGGDFGAVLAQLGQAKVLENKSGSLQAELSWRGYPWDFSQGMLDGKMQFELKKGRIIEAGNSASFLRIFGILNLNTVIKRLQLDFSDLLKSGVAFDKVTAKYDLKNGVATNLEPLKLAGDSANIEMTGSINLATKVLDQKMYVAIPLSSNAPIVALLLASPQVAGIAFVFDKLLGNKLAKLTALRYGITGSWLEPIIKPVTQTTDNNAPKVTQ